MRLAHPVEHLCVVDQYARADPAGEHHHVRLSEFGERLVDRHAQHPVVAAHFAALMPDEHHVDRRNSLQHFVGADGIQRGAAFEQWNRNQHGPPPLCAAREVRFILRFG